MTTIKDHTHDLAFLDGGEGVYCMDIDCGFRLTGGNLLSVLGDVCRVAFDARTRELENSRASLSLARSLAYCNAECEAAMKLVIELEQQLETERQAREDAEAALRRVIGQLTDEEIADLIRLAIGRVHRAVMR